MNDVLLEAGLSPNEARVYETLLRLGESAVQAIALKSGVHRRNVYDSLGKFVEKGLASEVFIKGEKRFVPVHPRRLMELLQQKEERLGKLLPTLEMTFNRVESTEEAYVYRGVAGFKNYLQDILDARETVYFIGAKGFWLDPRVQPYLARFERERKKRGIKFMHLFDAEIKTQKPEILKLVGKPYRFLPPAYSSQTAVDVFGDYVVTFVGAQPGQLDAEPVQFVMKSRRLADGYRKFFQFMWDHCE